MEENVIEKKQIKKPSWGLVRTIKYGISLANKSKVNTTGDDYIKPNKTIFMNKDFLTNAMIVKIEFSLNSYIMLISDGRVFTKGKDTLGRDLIGIGQVAKDFHQVIFKDTNNPNKTITIVSISAGDLHVLALDADRNVWGWGSNKFHQITQNNELEYKYPVMIDLKLNDLKICQIFCLAKSSMFICKNNIIKMIGSTREGFLGNFKEDKKLKDFSTNDVIEMTMINEYIQNQIKKSSKNFIEDYNSSKKLFSSKFNRLLKSNFLMTNLIETKSNHREILAKELEYLKVNTPSIINYSDLKYPTPNQQVILQIGQYFAAKLKKIEGVKEEMIFNLKMVFQEIEIKIINMKQKTAELSKVEEEIEFINNLRLEINVKMADKTKSEIEAFKNELNRREAILKNSREYFINLISTIMENLKILVVFLESKENERHSNALKLNKILDLENNILKNNHVVEDMLDLSFEIVPNTTNESDLKISNSYEKKLIELLRIFNKLDVNFNLIKQSKFMETHLRTPYLITEDIIARSYKELDLIEKDIIFSNNEQIESEKVRFITIYKMFKLYSDVIKEQNFFILRFHKILLQLKSFVLKIETNIRREMEEDENIKLPDIEYIYLDIIIQFLRSVKYRENFEEASMSSNEIKIVPKEKNQYRKEKRLLFEKLEKRAKYSKEKNTKTENLQTFGYETQDKNKSFFSWN